MNDHSDFLSLLFDRVAKHPDRTAIVFLNEEAHERSLTYRELWQRSVDVANHLRRQSPAQSDATVDGQPRALLLFPPGIDFFPAFLGTQLANWIPVPTNYPKPHREMPRLNSCARDCSPCIILSDAQTLATLDRSKLDPAADLPALAVDQLPSGDWPNDYTRHPQGITPASTAFLQYTSGSTSAPKGVVVSQQNLMANLEAIRRGFGLDWVRLTDQTVATSVFWLPHFHDMGLIGGVLAPLYIGFRTVLMSPQAFIRRPIQWLRTVQEYGAVVTGAPNFAFELCADRISPEHAQGLDLSSLRVMFCGAEPIRATALRAFESRFAAAGFNPESFYPCYGLAESTLLACGGHGPGRPRVLVADRQSMRQGTIRVVTTGATDNTTSLVSCGQAAASSEVVIVDPESRTRLAERQIGEIWLRGPSVAAGYWNTTADQRERFYAALESKRAGLSVFWGGAAKSSDQTGDAPRYFRTGDLGFVHSGQLYITGRIKELIIVRGRNYFPHDIEATVSQVDTQPCGRVAAVSIDGPRGEALGIAIEVSKRCTAAKFSSLVRRVRRQTIDEHDIDPRAVILVKTGAIPVTTSGKLRRNDSRGLFSPNAVSVLHRWYRSNALESPPIDLPILPDAPAEHDFQLIRDRVCDWMVQWLIVRGGIGADQIEVARRFEDYGLDSLMAIELVGDLEDACDVELTPTVAMQHGTILKMATRVASVHCGTDSKAVDSQTSSASASVSPS